MLHADVMREAGSAASLGIELGKPKFNLKKMVKRSRDVAGQLSGGISHLMKKNKIEVFLGRLVLGIRTLFWLVSKFLTAKTLS